MTSVTYLSGSPMVSKAVREIVLHALAAGFLTEQRGASATHVDLRQWTHEVGSAEELVRLARPKISLHGYTVTSDGFALYVQRIPQSRLTGVAA